MVHNIPPRSGPPSPRSDPWTPQHDPRPDVDLYARMTEDLINRNTTMRDSDPYATAAEQATKTGKQYAAREAAFAKWLIDTGKADQGYDVGQRFAEKNAFDAGWKARKEAEYRQIVNHPEKSSIDRTGLSVATLFPTEAEINESLK